MKDFYVHLLSNASTDEFPDNKANSFKNVYRIRSYLTPTRNGKWAW